MTIEELNFLLETSIEISLVDKLYLLKPLFSLAKYLSLDEEEKRNLDEKREQYEIVDYYLECKDYDLKHFDKWKNLNSILDIINLKKVLQWWYLNKDTSYEIKIQILYSLSKFIVKDDRDFYLLLIQEIFNFKDYSVGTDILFLATNALGYIEKTVNPSVPNGFWIKGDKKDIENSLIIYNRGVFFYEYIDKLAWFRGVKHLNNIEYKKSYSYKNNLFPTITGKNIGCNIDYKVSLLENSKIKLDLLLKVADKVLIKERQLDMLSFIEIVFNLKKIYKNKITNNKKDDFFIIFKDENITDIFIEFLLSYHDKYSDYSCTLKSKNSVDIKYELDIIEVLSMFSKLFLHITLYLMSKYRICLKKELELTNQEFLELLNIRI